MKKFWIIILLFVIISAAGIIGYNLLKDQIDPSAKTLTSDDNKYSMEIPASWNTAEKASDICILAAENRDSSMYAALSVNTYVADGTTIEDYISAYISDIASNSDDPSQHDDHCGTPAGYFRRKYGILLRTLHSIRRYFRPHQRFRDIYHRRLSPHRRNPRRMMPMKKI